MIARKEPNPIIKSTSKTKPKPLAQSKTTKVIEKPKSFFNSKSTKHQLNPLNQWLLLKTQSI